METIIYIPKGMYSKKREKSMCTISHLKKTKKIWDKGPPNMTLNFFFSTGHLLLVMQPTLNSRVVCFPSAYSLEGNKIFIFKCLSIEVCFWVSDEDIGPCLSVLVPHLVQTYSDSMHASSFSVSSCVLILLSSRALFCWCGTMVCILSTIF